VTASPIEKPRHEVALPHEKAGHVAILAWFPLPAHVTGVARIVAASSSTGTDLAAADVLRPAVVDRVIANRAPLVLASLGLLLLVAASGSFLLLAQRISRVGSPGGS
jgi:hypothetical protein